MNDKTQIKLIIGCIIGFFALILIGWGMHSTIRYNDSQDYQVIQSVSGEMSVNTEGGYYCAFFPKVWTYAKINSVFFSNDKKESRDGDGVNVIFNNKGQGDVSCQVVFRLFTDNERMLKLHQYARGDIEIIENLILAKLKDLMMTEASKITSSEAIEKREDYVRKIREQILNHKELSDMGIVVEQFNITQIAFDSQTVSLFKQQQESDLRKRTAESLAEQLEQEKIRVEKDAAKQIAEAKGAAEVEMMKQVTDAERQKKLAEIEAQRKVEVEKLAKEEALVKASKLLEVAEVEKKTEAARLEVIEIQAKQKVAEAQAKQKQIELSGAITEAEQVRLNIEKETKIGVASAWAEGIKSWQLPKTVIIGNGESKGESNPVSTLLQLMTVQKAEEVSK